ADVLAGMETRTALAHDDRACRDRLAAVSLDAEHLRIGIAAVARGAAALLVCHVRSLPGLRGWWDRDSGALAAVEFSLELVERLEVALGGQGRLLRPGARIVGRETRARRREQLAQAIDRGAGEFRKAADAGVGEHVLGDFGSDALDDREVVAAG